MTKIYIEEINDELKCVIDGNAKDLMILYAKLTRRMRKMTELQIIDFAYLIKEFYPLSRQIENNTVRDYLDWLVDLVMQDLTSREGRQGQDKRFLGAVQMANGLGLIPVKAYLPLYNWSIKLGLFLTGE